MNYVFDDNKGRIPFDSACEPYITALQSDLWGWLG